MQADADVPPRINLADLVRTSREDVVRYVNSPAFPTYMDNGDRVRDLVAALQQSNDVEIMALVIGRDQRDVTHSVSYLKAFRQSLRDNRSDMALMILAVVNYPLDLLADVLQIDRNSVDILSAKDCAYLDVMRAFERRDIELQSEWVNTFFVDFIAYMIIAYTDENDLLSNLIALDSPVILMYIADFDGDSGVRVFKEYARWKYNHGENDEEDSAYLIQAVGRFSMERRKEVMEYLSSTVNDATVVPNKILQSMLGLRGSWRRTEEEESVRNQTLQSCRRVMLETNKEGIYTEEEVVTLINEVDTMESSNDIVRSVESFVSGIIEGRYRHLLVIK